MLVDSTYAGGGGFRLSLGLPSPLYAGALLVVLIFAIQWAAVACARTKSSRMAGSVLVGLASIAVGATGSRSSVLVTLIGMAYMLFLEKWCVRQCRPTISYKGLGLVATALALGLVASGTWMRMTSAYLAADPSAQNRPLLWAAALDAFSSSSFAGIGNDQCLLLFLNWYAPLDHPINIVGFSSTLATIGIEFGVLPITVMLVCMAIPCVVPFALKPGARWCSAASAGCLAVFLSLLTTTLTLSALVSLAQAGFIIVALVYTGRSMRQSARLQAGYLLLATAGAVFGGLLLVRAIPRFPLRGEPLRYGFNSDGHITIFNAGSGERGSRVLWMGDSEITGANFGHVVRKVAKATGEGFTWEIYSGAADASPEVKASDLLLLLGNARASQVRGPSVAKVLIVHPTRAPEATDDQLRVAAVILPAVDQLGWNESWVAWAKSKSVDVQINPRTGRNLYFACQPIVDFLQRSR